MELAIRYLNSSVSIEASDLYTDLLWAAIRKRLPFTDLTQSTCAFSEAPAEGIFSIYSRVCKSRPSATVDHLVALTRVAAHGPPAEQTMLHKYPGMPWNILNVSMERDFAVGNG